MQKEHLLAAGETCGQNNHSCYTYLVTHIPSGKKYYGSRYAQGCNPSDLWVTYFTSSKEVHSLIGIDGKESFTYQIRRTFTNATDAISWEGRFLRKIDAKSRSDFLNKHNNDGLVKLVGDLNPMRNPTHKQKWKESAKGNKLGKALTKAHREAISKSLKGRKRSDKERKAISEGLKGKKHSDIFKENCRIRQLGVIPSEESKQKKREAIKGRKKYILDGVCKTYFPGSEPEGWTLKVKAA